MPVVSYRNSTSNHNVESREGFCGVVVSYRNSTSNHNYVHTIRRIGKVVSYRNSTSNHNWPNLISLYIVLYLIEIPHQTTTWQAEGQNAKQLYLIEIPHQTTTKIRSHPFSSTLYLIEIPHQTTTFRFCYTDTWRCILSKFHIKPQPTPRVTVCRDRCILSKFHIKPQLRTSCFGTPGVVSYRNSTSNHNFVGSVRIFVVVVSYRNSTSNHNV